MTKRDLLDRLDALRTAAETLPEDAAVDCAMAFKPDYSGTTGSIALTQNLTAAAAAFCAEDVREIDCGDRIYRFFYVGGVRVGMYEDK